MREHSVFTWSRKMFEAEDIIRVKLPCPPLYQGGELVQVDENDYDIGLRILEPTEQRVGHIDLLPRTLAENLLRTGVLAIESH